MNVEKALRFVSIEGLEQIGAGAHSAVNRLDGETILKVVSGMATMRMLLSPFLQGIHGAEETSRRRLLRVGPEFFPQIDELCELIRSEF